MTSVAHHLSALADRDPDAHIVHRLNTAIAKSNRSAQEISMTELIPVVDDTRALIALFDSIANAPVAVHIDMHDGSIVQTLKAWASTRGIAVEYGALTVDDCGFVVDRFTARIGASRVVVFDMANKRPIANDERTAADGSWRPTDAAVSQ